MTGKEYFNWFTEEEKTKWIKNFEKGDFDDFVDFEDVMTKDYKNYFVFIFGSFIVSESNEGEEYWQNIYHKNKNFDNLSVKPGFGFFGMFKQPKIF
jgi:hypothetical protein